MRLLDELRRLQQTLRDLRRADAAAEESARFELTQSTRHFSRKTQKVLDDTMALSATLMRAGEVDEANLLIAQVEKEVREEEAALREAMNEVKAERHERRKRMTRLRLARFLAAMVAGASLMALSVGGLAVASLFLEDDGARSNETAVNVAAQKNDAKKGKRVKIAGVSVKLTARQLATYNDLSSGTTVDGDDVALLLTAVLPQVPVELVNQVESAIVGISGTVELPAAVQDLKDAAARMTNPPKEKQSKPKDEPSPQPSEEPSPEPSESPSDEPSDDGSSGGKSNEDDGLPPVPNPPAPGLGS